MEQEAAREDADSQPTYRIERPVYSEALIRSKLLSRKENSITLRERLANHFRCSSARARAAVLSFLPILTWLPSYPVRRFLFSDVVSGLSTGVVQLPQGLAYAMLAAVPPVYGLYSSFYPVLLYTFFGTSRHISVGTFAVMSLMIGGVAVREAPDDMFNVLPANASNMSATVDTEARDARRVQVAVMLTTLVGIIQILFGVLRFGFVTIYLTEPLVRGFTTAASLHVFVSQLKYLLGVKTQRFCGVLSIVYSLKAVLWNITSTNVATLILGLVGIVFLYLVKYVNERFKKKLPVPIPGEIIVVMVSTGVSYGLSLSDDYMVDVVGKIPTGLLPPAAPDFSLFPRLITDSFTVAIVGFSMDISLAKTFALKHGYSVDGNQELIALGLCNFISSFFQTFAISCSMSRTLVQESTGGKTQIAGLMASLVVLLVVVAIGFVFQPLPQTALAAIIMVNLLGMFKQFRDIPNLWRTSKIELAIWLVACAASVLLGLDYGLLVAVLFAMLTVIYRTQSPKSSVLGHVPGTGLYYDVDEYEEAAEYEGIKIFHSNSSIYFANSDLYVTSLKEKTGVNPEHIQAARKARKKQEAKANDNHSSPPQICVKYGKQEVTREVSSDNHVAVQHINGPVGDSCPDVDSEVVHLKTPNAVHSIVLDWTPVTFIDSVGAKAIKQVSKEYAAVGVRVVIAACSRSLLAELDTLQFFTGVMTPDVMFPTVHDAVLHCHHSGSCPVAVAAVAAPPPVEELS
ncbi:putative prestin [Scophthalmus maximus]|uniref:Putative prestin n=2 Tax=Scophthalmus maximus TaxID=52904 RepID=A0A2U9BAI4_SCOMX|nr:prestin isoform X2 [Scophthalmus maximus]XP_035480269.1 prestin isoform X2 [Scophthalmus maximus]XP_047193280.1 prestin isoform X2 [Scophthalmus maximus]XP_047193290.1 prestin isoform X2 [Scophthalmus maximus]XP_047193292.1 prestin isoform X2 [Scophthalmus maximus]AWP00965.1 putative prestin [Scophthalmus maximus]